VTWLEWLIVPALLLAIVAVVVAVQNRRRLLAWRAAAAPAATTARAPSRPQVAFVANPSKPGVVDLRDAAIQACAARYLPEPMWLETTEEDPGVGQARRAVADGADVVVAAGGDGTVRAVAEGLVGTNAAMGLIPLGTGNLLARNLDLPLGNLPALLRIALTGTDRPIDVGWITILRDATGDRIDDDETTDHAGAEVEGAQATDATDATEPPDAAPTDTADDLPDREAPTRLPSEREHIFLVIGGLGFDAAMVADTDADLKARVGWIAYFVGGVRHLHARRMRLDVRLDEEPWHSVRLRSLLIGNCGRLPGGITLLPDAVLDDGWLDVGEIDTRGGLVGWTQLFGEVAMQRFGFRTDLPNRIGRIDHARARRIRVRTRDPQQVQVDGDLIGTAYEVEARVDHLALTVKVD